MIADGSRDFSSVYTAWLRKPLVLLIAIRRCHVPNPCSILGESAAAVRLRISPGLEIDLRKELILAVGGFPCELARARGRKRSRICSRPYRNFNTQFQLLLSR